MGAHKWNEIYELRFPTNTILRRRLPIKASNLCVL